jgi:predicted MPP superfamily phosphohydrolase
LTLRRPWRWALVALALAVIVLGVWAFWLEPASLTVAEERVLLPAPLGGPLRLAVLTDLHVGSRFNGLDRLRQIVDRTNAARPDVVCLLGDLVIQGVAGGRFVTPEAIAAELGRLKSRAGIVAVLGNHDAWLDHDRVQRALERSGIPVVEERAVRLSTPAGPVWFAGVSDLWTGRHDIAAALAPADDAAPLVLLTHNPDVFPDVPPRVALTLAGHTHGGQVRLPLLGTPIVPSRFGARYAAGHVVEDGRHLYVATGIGTSLVPVRFRVPPAITLLVVAGSGAGGDGSGRAMTGAPP